MEADHSFPLIAITPPEPVADEAAKIVAIIEAGWWRVHLRHPETDAETIAGIIAAIPARVRKHVSMHDRFGLAEMYGIGGVHLNRRSAMPPYGWKGHVSRSCHDIDDVRRCAGLDYLTLSPVFESISKPGYAGVEFAPLPAGVKVIALGGITPDRLGGIRASGFAGAAMLGAIPWQGTVAEIKEFATKTLEIC